MDGVLTVQLNLVQLDSLPFRSLVNVTVSPKLILSGIPVIASSGIASSGPAAKATPAMFVVINRMAVRTLEMVRFRNVFIVNFV